MRFESRRGPKRKKREKNVFYKLENLSLVIFSLFLFLYISKMNFKA
jgi:hypothetical protein